MSGVNADVLRLVLTIFSDLPESELPRLDRNESTAGRPSFETLLKLFHKRVFNLAYRLLGDFDEAADLTQETFVKAYKAYRRFRGTSDAAYPWLCRIAVNGCKNRFKELERRNRYETRSLDGGPESDGLEIGDGSADPAGIVERQDLENRIQEAIQALPPEFRVVVILRDMQGLTYKEIADATGFTIETVKARLFRGRGILRRRFAPYLSNE